MVVHYQKNYEVQKPNPIKSKLIELTNLYYNLYQVLFLQFVFKQIVK